VDFQMPLLLAHTNDSYMAGSNHLGNPYKSGFSGVSRVLPDIVCIEGKSAHI
jgi:hypothetical protein